MKTFDLTSDIHADFWVGSNNPIEKQRKQFTLLFEKLIPNNPSKTLVIAGDLGHYNYQNIIVLNVLHKFYEHIVLVHGNHDLYMVNKSIMEKFKYDSFNRLNEMISLVSKLDYAHYLTGSTIELDNIRFGGTGMWYDNSYAKETFSLNDYGCDAIWNHYMNDSVLIKENKSQLNRYKLFSEQYELMKSVINTNCDVIVSHISPTSKLFKPEFQTPSSTFYQFNGSEFLSSLDSSKVWCYGHTHDPMQNIDINGCRLMCNPLGYPSNSFYSFQDWTNLEFPSCRKFLTINV